MRKTSIVAPLILIGIGTLLLLRNLYPEMPLLSMLGRYWPFLLIVWGGARLAEVLYWASQAKPLPERGISGGEWTLVIFLCFLGGGLYFFNEGRGREWRERDWIRIGGLEAFGESYEYPLSAAVKSGKTPKLVIESFRGNARITGGDGEEVRVTGRKSIRSLDQKGAEDANQRTPFELVQQGEQVIVRTNQDRAGEVRRIEAELEISVPRGASIEARGRRGDFDINDIQGRVEITSDNAGVRIAKVVGDVVVDLRNSDIVRVVDAKGAVEVKGRGSDVLLENVEGTALVQGEYTGTIEFRKIARAMRFQSSRTSMAFEKVPGLVKLEGGQLAASDVVGPGRIESRSKDVRVSDCTNSLEVSVDRGDIEIRPGRLPLAAVTARTRGGDIEIVLPEQAKFDLEATTDRGEVNNDWGSPLRVSDNEQERRGGRISGTVGGGGPKIVLETHRGSVTVRKGGAGDKVTSAFPEFPETPKAPKAPAAPELPRVRQ